MRYHNPSSMDFDRKIRCYRFHLQNSRDVVRFYHPSGMEFGRKIRYYRFYPQNIRDGGGFSSSIQQKF